MATKVKAAVLAWEHYPYLSFIVHP